ncbi:MAG TPA: helix-turn-helix domain-containing protein [Conexibacter sp.]|nr:helix-turn-helix domain-containing protein [Conexibacter sp.]
MADLVARIGRAAAAQEMLAELRKQIASYERLSSELSEAAVLDTCTRNLRMWHQWLASGGEPAPAALDELRESVRARADAGVPLEDLLHAYRIAGRLGWQILRRHAGPREQPVLLDAAELLMLYLDLLSEVVTQTYLAERERLVSEEERGARELVERIVDGTPLTVEERELARRLDVPLRDRYVPFAAAIPGASPRRHAALAARLRGDGRLAVTEGDRVFGLALTAPEAEDLGEGARAVLALAEETPRAELGCAREELQLLVDHGRRERLAGVLTPTSHALELLLARSPRIAAALRARVLEPLVRGGEGADLVHTLRTLVRCGFDRAETSRALHVHRNTLGYRIGRIEQLAALDLARPRDAACVYLALAVAAGGASGGVRQAA